MHRVSNPLIQAFYKSKLYKVYSVANMSFRMFLVKGAKPLIMTSGLFFGLYGTYQWNRTKESLHLDKGMSKEDLEKVFHDIDTDGSGYIEEKELLNYLKKKGVKQIGEYEAQAMMEAADETKDGKLSLEEGRDLIRGTHNVGPGQKMVPKQRPAGEGGVKSKVDPHDYVKKP